MSSATKRTLISVHVPKSAGCSLRTTFQSVVRPGRLLLDYAQDPVDPATPLPPAQPQRVTPRLSRARVIHGHFHIRKYDGLTDAARAVMLREPVANMISIYFFWQHLAERQHGGHELFRAFAAERPTLLAFARTPTFRYLLTRTFFGDYDMSRFDLIGDFDERPAFLADLAALLGTRLDASRHENRTPASLARRQVEDDTPLMRALRDLLADDVRFYEHWTDSARAARLRRTG